MCMFLKLANVTYLTQKQTKGKKVDASASSIP